MKRTFTKEPVIPQGWIPKPERDKYNFLDWLANFQHWAQSLNVSSHYSGPIEKYYHDQRN